MVGWGHSTKCDVDCVFKSDVGFVDFSPAADRNSQNICTLFYLMSADFVLWGQITGSQKNIKRDNHTQFL
jgi:hypothetical protein